MAWLTLLILGPFIVALLLGRLTRIRIPILLLPSIGIALAYWVVVGWRADSFELDRTALVIIVGIGCALWVFVWAAGAITGRMFQRDEDRELDTR